MKAKVTREFFGVVDGKYHPRTIHVGEIITGDLARVAVKEGDGVAYPLEQPPRNAAHAEAPRVAETGRPLLSLRRPGRA